MQGSYNRKHKIQKVLKDMMERVLDKVLVKDPFLVDRHRKEKPLYAALVPDEIFKGSHFERRFTTPFGKVWENLALVVARHHIGNAEVNQRITGLVRAERLGKIQEVLSWLEHGRDSAGARIRPDWDKELKYVLSGGGNPVHVDVICDVFAWSRDEKTKLAFELKAPLPNSDQTKVSKEKLLKLYAMEPMQVTSAYYALPYNPYGQKRTDYTWSFPMRWFDMHRDSVVLIGRDFWDVIGGEGTYDAFIEAVNELGEHYKERIYRDYLGIEPPGRPEGPFRVRELEEGEYEG
ncbi:MAG: TdeIII family type II restriction endonuclease [Candidatus Methanosuratincola sp.]